jgi:predicted nuclease of predicted toxin-antitoxin system
MRQAGYDMASIVEESPGIDDTLVLSRAVNEERIILTFDRDYGELIYRLSLPAPKGVIYFRFRPQDPEEPAQLLLNLFQNTTLQFEGWFTVLERNQLRQRPLPNKSKA